MFSAVDRIYDIPLPAIPSFTNSGELDLVICATLQLLIALTEIQLLVRPTAGEFIGIAVASAMYHAANAVKVDVVLGIAATRHNSINDPTVRTVPSESKAWDSMVFWNGLLDVHVGDEILLANQIAIGGAV
jgi:hypothetical protein